VSVIQLRVSSNLLHGWFVNVYTKRYWIRLKLSFHSVTYVAAFIQGSQQKKNVTNDVRVLARSTENTLNERYIISQLSSWWSHYWEPDTQSAIQ